MKKESFVSLIFGTALLAVANSLTAQNITPLPIHISPPAVINFTQLAAEELAHPVLPESRFIEQGEDREPDFEFVPKNIPPNAVTNNIPTGHHHKALPNSPLPIASWNGTMDNGSLIPPDIRGAAGNTYIMETTNQDYKIYAKGGLLHNTVNVSTFWAQLHGSGYFDPHVLYDPAHGGHFIVCMDGNVSNGNGGLFVAVSKTDDPTGLWYTYSIDNGDTASADLLDFPLMGYNSNWVVISANDFVGHNTYGKFFVMNRDSLYNGTLGIVNTFTDANSFTAGPAQTYDTTQLTEYLVQDANGNQGGMGYMQVGSISGPVDAPVYNAGNNVGVNQPWSEHTLGALQQGGIETLEDGGTGVSNAVYRNGTLWFTHTVYLPSTGATHDGVDWWQVNPVTDSVLQFGRVEDASGGMFYYYPSINVNTSDDALLGFTMSSGFTYAGAGYALHLHTDVLNGMENPYQYKTGLAYYYKTLGGTRNRWGDFTGTAVDPVDNSFWNFSQFANTSNRWGTVIAHVGDTAGTCIAHASFANSSSNSCGIPFTVNFTNTSLSADSSLWSFGDGTGSSGRSPSHTYTAPGDYTVSLVVSANNCGVDSDVQSQLIHVTDHNPSTSPAQNICKGQSVTLTASGTGTLNWYNTPTGGAPVDTGTTFSSPALNASTIYYAESAIYGPVNSCGPADSSLGGGSFSTNGTIRYLEFNCTEPQILISVDVYANNTGNRIINLKDAAGNLLQSDTVNINAGHQTVPLNFQVPAGNALRLSNGNTPNLYRNTVGAAFPYYSTDSSVTITGSGFGARYNLFYNWQLKSASCVSYRVPIPVTVFTTGSGFAYNITALNTLNFTPTVTTAITYSWNFGDGSSSLQQSPTHVYGSAGTYPVTLVESNGTCSDTVTQTISTVASGINDMSGLQSIRLFPNPANDILGVTINIQEPSVQWTLSVQNILGEKLIEQPALLNTGENKLSIDVSRLTGGVYFLCLQNGKAATVRKFVKE